MELSHFLANPWDRKSLHASYRASMLDMSPAPEYATGEVVLASTYRQIGFSGSKISENSVPSRGTEFHRRIRKKSKGKKDLTEEGIVDAELWNRIVTGTLRSPKRPNQAATRFLQISPVVPDTAIYSMTARQSKGSWNPGALVSKIVQLGSKGNDRANHLWNELYRHLSVENNDDIWARFLQQEFESWRTKDLQDAWNAPGLIEKDESIFAWCASDQCGPSTRFTRDLSASLLLKPHLTRRQWISLIESVLRIGTASHVLWLCSINHSCFTTAMSILEGGDVPDAKSLNELFGVQRGFWRYGQNAAATLNDYATDFVKARAGLNLLLHQLEEFDNTNAIGKCFNHLGSIRDFYQWLAKIRDTFDMYQFRRNYQVVLETDHRVVAGKKGISSNLKEFLLYVLAQRQTSEPGLESYDQGFFLAKKGGYRSAPWAVLLGPVSILMLVHACTQQSRGPKTIVDFCKHLGEYGIEIQPQDVAGSLLDKTLRNLGLVLDSPDAEGGMVITSPFDLLMKEDEN